MKKKKETISTEDYISLKKLADNQETVLVISMFLFAVLIALFARNNEDLSSAIRQKNKIIKYYELREDHEEKAGELKYRCEKLNKYTKYANYYSFGGEHGSCWVNGVRITTIEQLERAELHYKLGEGKK